MIDNLKKWLAKNYNVSESDIESYFEQKDVTGFLIIWTIFEQILFGGFLKYADIQRYSESNSNKWNEELESQFEYFHERYQDSRKYRNLVHGENRSEISRILKVEQIEANSTEKLHFLIYVVYRYRNNIFHGNKDVESWLQFRPQIERCVSIMIQLIGE